MSVERAGSVTSGIPWADDAVVLRGFIASDIDYLVEYRNIESVWRLQDWDVPYSEESALRFLEDDVAVLHRGEWVQLAIEFHGRFVGDVGFTVPEPHGRSWIGYSLHPDYWGRGIASRAVQLCIDRLTRLGAATIRASVDPRNLPSSRLLLRCGFTLLDEKQPITVRGEDYMDDVYELAAGPGAVGTDGS